MAQTRATDLHRVYIQSLLSRRAVPEPIALELYKRAITACRSTDDTFRPTHAPDVSGLASFLEDVSNLLEEVGMVVRRGKEDLKGGNWVVLCNTDPSGVAQLATDLSPLELAYFREVLTAIVDSYPANSIGSNHALKLTTELQSNMQRTTAEGLLAAFTSRQWLALSRRGRYSLAPRAMLELESYLKQQFEDDVRTCRRCSKLVMAGKICGVDDCDEHYHGYCFDTIQRSGRPICLSCKTAFAEVPPKPLGEKAVSMEQDGWGGVQGGRKRKRNGAAGRRTSGRRDEEDGEEEDENEEDVEQEGGEEDED